MRICVCVSVWMLLLLYCYGICKSLSDEGASRWYNKNVNMICFSLIVLTLIEHKFYGIHDIHGYMHSALIHIRLKGNAIRMLINCYCYLIYSHSARDWKWCSKRWLACIGKEESEGNDYAYWLLRIVYVHRNCKAAWASEEHKINFRVECGWISI